MKLPVVLQSNGTECGCACVTMVANAHGRNCSIGQMRRQVGHGATAASVRTVMELARHVHLHARAMRLEPDEVRGLKLPCILLWGTNHFVVLKRVTARGWHVNDPAAGARFYRNIEVHSLFGGIAVELVPGAEQWTNDAPERVRLADLWRQTTGATRALLVIVALSIALQVVALLSPLYVQLVVDDALARNDTDLLAVLAIAFLALTVLGGVIGHLRSVLSLRLGASLNEQLSSNLCAHLLRLTYLFFVHRDIGDINARFGSLAPVLRLFTAGVVTIVIDGLLALTTLALLFYYHTLLTLVMLAFLAAVMVIQLGALPRMQLLTNDSIRRTAAEQTLFIESLRSILSLKANGMETARSDLWRRHHADSVDAAIALGGFGLKVDLARALLTGAEGVLVVYLGALVVIESELSIGMLYAFIAYKTHFARASTALVEQAVEIRMLRLHLERLADIALEPADSATGTDLIQAPLRGAVEVHELTFRYTRNAPPVLQNVSIDIPAGSDVAILGGSGSGKSTLLKCLLGLIQPDTGGIRFDGRPLSACIESVRSSAGAVLQGDTLFTGTIRDNVALFALEPDDARVAQCCEVAGIDADVAALPLGYDTPLGDMGATLSAGQLQRLLLARALYKRPGVLILDEATANLDDTTRRHVNERLRQLGITIVRVTHRGDEIADCHAVYRLDGGRLERVAVAVEPRR